MLTLQHFATKLYRGFVTIKTHRSDWIKLYQELLFHTCKKILTVYLHEFEQYFYSQSYKYERAFWNVVTTFLQTNAFIVNLWLLPTIVISP